MRVAVLLFAGPMIDRPTIVSSNRHESTPTMRAWLIRLALVAVHVASAKVTYSHDYHPNHVGAIRVDKVTIAEGHHADYPAPTLWAEPANFSGTNAWTTLSWSGVPQPDVGDFIGTSAACHTAEALLFWNAW